jgi:hypothetical protein
MLNNCKDHEQPSDTFHAFATPLDAGGLDLDASPAPLNMIETQLSAHAKQQAQRRGITRSTLDLILRHGDRSRKLSTNARARWVSQRARDQLIRAGVPSREVDRTRSVRLIVALDDNVVMTVEHMLRRRAWA